MKSEHFWSGFFLGFFGKLALCRTQYENFMILFNTTKQLMMHNIIINTASIYISIQMLQCGKLSCMINFIYYTDDMEKLHSITMGIFV